MTEAGADAPVPEDSGEAVIAPAPEATIEDASAGTSNGTAQAPAA